MRPGPAPDPRSTGRNTPAVDWTEVVDKPFDYVAAGRLLPETRPWHDDARAWFKITASMPHAVLWRDADWLALYDLAIMKHKFYQGAASSGEVVEIRQRETQFGNTLDARVKLRIRYVADLSTGLAAEPSPEPTSGVTNITSARDRLRRAAS